MAEDGKKSAVNANRGQDWEVVSLTASAYAACPGPKKPDESESQSDLKLSENESPATMLQSQHFVFSSHHEGLPSEKEIGEVAENSEIDKHTKSENSSENIEGSANLKSDEFASEIEMGRKGLKCGEEAAGSCEGLEISYNIKPGSSFETLQQSAPELFAENQTQIPLVTGKDVESFKGLDWIEPRQGSALDDDDISVVAAKLKIFHDVGGVSSPSNCDESSVLANLHKEVEEQSFGGAKPLSSNDSIQHGKDKDHPAKASKAMKKGGKDHSYEAWVKRQAAALRDQLRQSNTLWPIAIAVAFTGLVILGQRWHHERWQNQHLRLELGEKEEKVSQMMYQVARLKEAMTGRRKVPIIRSGST